jgi:hypothetical protein
VRADFSGPHRPLNQAGAPRHEIAIAASRHFPRTELPLSYLFGVAGVLLLQVGFSFAIIMATSGGGSFVALGAMLLAVVGIPLTALINFLLIRSHRNDPASPCILRLALVSLALPATQLALMVLVSVFRL